MKILGVRLVPDLKWTPLYQRAGRGEMLAGFLRMVLNVAHLKFTDPRFVIFK